MLGPERFGPHTTPERAVRLVVGDPSIDGFVPDDADLGGAVLADFAGFDSWRTEDQALMNHAHDPFERVDVMATGRRVEITVDGRLMADSRRARLLLETGLPPRYYLPPDDVRTDLLADSPAATVCSYKGVASYLSAAGATSPGGTSSRSTTPPGFSRTCASGPSRPTWSSGGSACRAPQSPWSRRPGAAG